VSDGFQEVSNFFYGSELENFFFLLSVERNFFADQLLEALGLEDLEESPSDLRKIGPVSWWTRDEPPTNPEEEVALLTDIDLGEFYLEKLYLTAIANSRDSVMKNFLSDQYEAIQSKHEIIQQLIELKDARPKSHAVRTSRPSIAKATK